jgi:tRNA U55 pseudouridine synthase TruB
LGSIEQVPHRFSAIKVDGVRSYDRARRGESFENAARAVTIDRLECLLEEGGVFTLELECSSGTYVRVLIEEIGEALGVGATMMELVRTQAGPIRLERCSESVGISLGDALHFDEVFPLFGRLTLSHDEVTSAVLNGASISHALPRDEEQLVGVFRERSKDSESEWSDLLGIYRYQGGVLRPESVVPRVG